MASRVTGLPLLADYPSTAAMPSSHPLKSTGGLRRILKAGGYSLQGLRAAFRHEAAFRQELLLAAVLIPCAFWLGRTALEIAVLLLPVGLVLVVELINSAIEALADAISIEHNPLLGRAKDIGSAAVLICLLLTAVVWLLIAYSRFIG